MKDNKQIMAENIRYYLKKHNLSNTKLCKELDFRTSTFSDWLHARAYPRIDKIEKMAEYFNIDKSDLIEDKLTPSSNSFHISKEEEAYILAYRNADELTKAMVNKILKL